MPRENKVISFNFWWNVGNIHECVQVIHKHVSRLHICIQIYAWHVREGGDARGCMQLPGTWSLLRHHKERHLQNFSMCFPSIFLACSNKNESLVSFKLQNMISIRQQLSNACTKWNRESYLGVTYTFLDTWWHNIFDLVRLLMYSGGKEERQRRRMCACRHERTAQKWFDVRMAPILKYHGYLVIVHHMRAWKRRVRNFWRFSRVLLIQSEETVRLVYLLCEAKLWQIHDADVVIFVIVACISAICPESRALFFRNDLHSRNPRRISSSRCYECCLGMLYRMRTCCSSTPAYTSITTCFWPQDMLCLLAAGTGSSRRRFDISWI